MTSKNIELIEGLKHELSFVLTGVDDVGDFEPFGYVSPLGCNHQSWKIEKVDESYFIPALKNGIYNYQIFIKQLSTNKDFLALEGKLEVKNSLMVENNSSLGGTELEITFDANTTEIHCEIGQGLRGEKGDKGDKGDKGERGIDGTVILPKNNTWTGTNTFVKGLHALPLGATTALGAPAYGLSVSADGGLQLWGTHFLQGDAHADNTLKIVHNSLSLGSTDTAAIGFDYANNVIFRTMPNDGGTANDSAGGVYRFEAWQWADDSHTSKVEMAVDVRKPNAGTLCDESLMNRAEVLAAIEENAPVPDLPIAIGEKTDAPAPVARELNSIALGYKALAGGSYSMALGYNASASELRTIALGLNSSSSGWDAMALGCQSSANGGNALAVGGTASANGTNTTAVGSGAKAMDELAFAVGNAAKANAKYTTAVGSTAESNGRYSVAIGYQAKATAEAATIVGVGEAKGKQSLALGYASHAWNQYTIALGGYTYVKGLNAAALGYGAHANNAYSLAVGYRTMVNDDGATVIASWDSAGTTQTLLYLMGANSPLATTYEDGAACMGYVVKDKSGNILECGTRKLSEIFTNNTAFAPASMDLEAPAPTPFMPTGITDPIEFPEEPEEITEEQ